MYLNTQVDGAFPPSPRLGPFVTTNDNIMDRYQSNDQSQQLCHTSTTSFTNTLPAISIATDFYPEAFQAAPDLRVLTSDDVVFYLHTEIATKFSPNAFRLLLGTASFSSEDGFVIYVQEMSEVFNVVAHFLYALPYTTSIPSLHSFLAGILVMPAYEIDVNAYLVPSNPCYQHVLTYTPLFPVDVYAVAAQFGLEHLASSASSHLISIPIYNISDDMAQRIGGIYLKRLVNLQVRRTAALKQIILPAPYPHESIDCCDLVEQRKLQRAWALVAAHLSWDPRPDMPVSNIVTAFNSLHDRIECEFCKEGIQARLKDIVAQWIAVECTI